MKKTALRQPIPNTASKSARVTAQAVLRALDKNEYRGGVKAIEYRDSFSDGESNQEGLVRIHRDRDGRVYFQVPRVPVASIRLRPTRSKTLLAAKNVGPLESWLENNPLIFSFLDTDKLRRA